MEMKNKKSLTLRIILLIVSIMINGFSVSVYVKSNLGVSTNSSIPFVITSIIPALSLGMTTIIFQILLLVILVFICGFKKQYLISFVLGCFFGSVIDIWNFLWTKIPIEKLHPIVLYIIAFFTLAFGIALTLSTELPTLPYDYFTKDIATKTRKTIGFVKTASDISYVVISIILSYLTAGKIYGVGIGTIISMLFTGIFVHLLHKFIKKYLKLKEQEAYLGKTNFSNG
ncbi:YczE/YyaS/YitT family protein [Brachyspira catarrhinii]|uniref:YitT family protein n=1 Tax=Brachyspira catarrhinii TaxID=2528966 RepID=A0ABY2TT29_9SPIR|nr:DUF6198 family protein [Brachyspira catarrhinii]TKZ36048.1 hypothetical protein EZH24_02080 [Brachyspira catarrhinii]